MYHRGIYSSFLEVFIYPSGVNVVDLQSLWSGTYPTGVLILKNVKKYASKLKYVI